jgi:two-component system sensor histidine kinase KdpD
MNIVTNSISEPSNTIPDRKRDLVITCIEDHPKAILLLLAAYKRAQEINGRWRVVFIETADHNKGTYEQWNEHRLRLLTRAKQMGAETEHVEALSITQGLSQLLEREAGNVAHIILGKIEAEDTLSRLRKLPWLKLIDIASAHAKLEIIPLTGQFRQPLKDRLLSRLREVEPRHIIYAVAGVAVPCLLTMLLKSTLSPALFRINEQNISILFIISCAFIAGRYGLIPGLVTAIAGFFVQNYYFTVPYNSIKLNSITDLFSMGLFLTAALVLALFTSHMREYVKRITKREMRTEMLFMLYRLTSEAFSRQQAIETLQQNLERMLSADIAFFMPTALNPKVLEISSPAGLELSENDKNALSICWSDMKSTGAASPYNPGTSWRFEPMISTNGEIGVLGVRPYSYGQLDAWFGRMLSATADQTAAILSHIELERSMEESRISEEREKLRVMLLSSVSHDLKTPLASIIGALSAHLTLGDKLKPEKHTELIEGSLEEARRLDSFITNILDMTRLETGNIKFKQEWCGLKHFMDDLSKRMSHRLKNRQLRIEMPRNQIDVYMDVIMTGQVVQNLLDNACKYTQQGTPIEVIWNTDHDNGITCSIRDHGDGVPESQFSHIFDKFARLHKKDSQTAGTGLGLAIAKTVMESQGGWITVENHPQGGAMFTFFLPRWRQAEQIEQEKSYAAH